MQIQHIMITKKDSRVNEHLIIIFYMKGLAQSDLQVHFEIAPFHDCVKNGNK